LASKVDLFLAIRFDHEQGLSVRAIARKYGVHRRMVYQALASPVPPARKVPSRSAPALGPWKTVIDGWLREDLAAPRKQRHTATRIHERLVAEHGAQLSYSAVQRYIKARRGQIKAEAGVGAHSGFVPQAHMPGGEAEVDFGAVSVLLRGVQVTCRMFVMRLSYSGYAIHRVYPSEGQDALLAGHVEAFAAFGGVPAGQVRYDNLTSAVAKVLAGRDRVEQARWAQFRSYYRFDAFYCEPGVGGAHEKGGVEGEIGRFRRRYFVPVPQVGSLAELNERLAAIDAAQGDRVIARRSRTVGTDFQHEAGLLAPLPDEPFQVAIETHVKVDNHARVSVHTNWYSVPASLIGRQLLARVWAERIELLDGPRLIATHERIPGRCQERLRLDDYLELLARKPGALPGSIPLAQARADGTFTQAHERWWNAARRAHGDAAGTKELIEVLLAHRHIPHQDLVAGLRAALAAGALTADAVKILTRQLTERPTIAHRETPGILLPLPPAPAPDGEQEHLAPVIELRPRALPALNAYDQLLARHRTTDPNAAGE